MKAKVIFVKTNGAHIKCVQLLLLWWLFLRKPETNLLKFVDQVATENQEGVHWCVTKPFVSFDWPRKLQETLIGPPPKTNFQFHLIKIGNYLSVVEMRSVEAGKRVLFISTRFVSNNFQKKMLLVLQIIIIANSQKIRAGQNKN